ncbi:diaminopimelate decarboxylase [Subtercola boreus]|uniref:Diaminopimelate decarboxylase n=1 Tax=Subtercola boreus TaxID=120213 RepID=A0A3E0VRG4_9MICO|nr:diaminopimelate decarboxylase [Subtercola boreus]
MSTWEVDLGHIEHWLLELDQGSYEHVIAAVELLSTYGPQLGRPLMDSVSGSAHKNMKELRPGSSGRSELRVLFAFDSHRTAILLVAGDKAGRWKKWYQENIPVADVRFENHENTLRGERR